ncbi:MAG TPA: VOC family protein [Nocardia sp.]|uniref:VOC family protein n=1 Tax=Nocardia TaxID=1817 RepID=UPI00245811AD|nr:MULTISPECIES: VOC family protein [Nocardia]HLS76914.1 VOC family protein [Nocardia sp.]
MSDVDPVPAGYPALSPGLAVDGAAEAVEFYKRVFGATERMRMPRPDGRIAHCELMIGGSVLMLGDPAPEVGFFDPQAVGGTPVSLHVYVPDADAAFVTAMELGAREVEAVSLRFYGDRSGCFVDPWGHRWTVATHVEDVPPDEMDRRMAGLFGES